MTARQRARLLLLTPAELSRDPRARRAAAAARRAEIEVTGVCVGLSAPAPLAEVSVIRIPQDALTRNQTGKQRGEGVLWREARGLFRLARLARTTVRLAHAANALQPTVVHANDFDTLPAAALIARRARARLVYDAHELYSSFEAQPPRVWALAQTWLEGVLARRADAVVTVSLPLAMRLHELHRLTRMPLIALNCPPISPDPNDVAVSHLGPLRTVYQAAAGPNRVLEDVLQAAALTSTGTQFTLRVEGITVGELSREVSARRLGHVVSIVDPVPPDRLVEALTPFQIGLVIDRRGTANTELALPNKLFEYLMAGLAVVVPRLAAMTELVEGEQIGLTYEPGDPADLARALDELAADRPRLEAMQRRARELAVTRYNAEAQEPVLLEAWGL